MDGEAPTAAELQDILLSLAEDPERLNKMKKNCSDFIKIKAEDVIVEQLNKEL